MNALSISQEVHAKLVSQSAELEESKVQLIDEFFPLPCRERDDFAQFLDEYLGRINELLQNSAAPGACCDGTLPFVTLDCAVEVKNLDNGQTFSWHIVLPSQNRVGKGCVSCLSPVGKSLLLNQAGDTITVSAPRGTARYQILSAVMK